MLFIYTTLNDKRVPLYNTPHYNVDNLWFRNLNQDLPQLQFQRFQIFWSWFTIANMWNFYAQLHWLDGSTKRGMSAIALSTYCLKTSLTIHTWGYYKPFYRLDIAFAYPKLSIVSLLIGSLNSLTLLLSILIANPSLSFSYIHAQYMNTLLCNL